MTIKALEELRDRLGDNAVNSYIDMNWDEVRPIIYAIEAEIDERFMELPVDADGIPIHLGDRLKGVFETFEVCAVGEYHGEHCAYWADGRHWDRAFSCHHVKPRTVEDVLEDFGAKMHGITGEESEALVAEAAAEIRELMKKGL